jgi:hypothetical protein
MLLIHPFSPFPCPVSPTPLPCRFLLVGIPGHYKANKSVSWVELRGFRDNMRLAGPDSEEDSAEDSGEAGEEGEEEEEESAAPRSKRQKTLKAKAGKRAKAAAAAGAARRVAAPKPGSKKRKAAAVGQPLHPAFVPVVQDAAWLAAQQRRPGFIAADVSNGVEQRQIPVFNEVDEERLPPGLEYVR